MGAEHSKAEAMLRHGKTGVVVGLALYFFSLFQTDMFSFDLFIFFRTYLMTIGLIIFIVLIS